MRNISKALVIASILTAAGVARADEGSDSSDSEGGYTFGLALTIGEGMYFVNNGVHRGPVTLELVPSLGWAWFKFDLGLTTTLESVEIAGLNVGHWSFSFRPGGRLTPPFMPLYLRVALPLQIQDHGFDWGLMLGVGVDITILIVGIVFEIDTQLTDQLKWGNTGIPLEFRLGVSVHF
jgi:hypothetical protein